MSEKRGLTQAGLLMRKLPIPHINPKTGRRDGAVSGFSRSLYDAIRMTHYSSGIESLQNTRLFSMLLGQESCSI